jgi:septal ring factor EnvC (AmiA/AmiB activator)
MEEKGFRQPGSPKPAANAPEPGGFQVLPGTYKVVINYARASDSTFVTVKDDPRIGNRNTVKLAQRNMYNRLRKSADKLTEGMDRLTESEEILSKMQTQLRGLEGKDIDSLRRETTRMQDEIKSIRDFISGKASDKQGLARNPFDVTAMSLLQSAQQSIGSKMVEPGTQVEQMVQNAEIAVAAVLQRLNTFFDGKWKNYRALVEGTKLNLFKDYKPIE